MRFADIHGHEDIKRRLVEMADQSRLPHALLFEGPSGTAKFMLARAFAQYIHCENPSGGDSCGSCPSCLQHQTFNHIDTIYSYPVIKKDSNHPAISADFFSDFKEMMTDYPYMDIDRWGILIKADNKQPKHYVDEGAELLRRLNYHAHQSRYKIVLLWLPERMNEDMANKMLKLIEEPHDDTIFILSSDSPRQILPTIYSRTQRVSVARYSDEDVAAILTSSMAIDPAVARQVAHLASGNVNEAIELVTVSKSRQKFLSLFIELMRKAYQRKIGLLRQWSVDVAGMGREQELAFLDYCARMIRENFILNLHIDQLNYLTPDEMAFSTNFARFINERNVLKLFEMINDARADIAGNANGKIVMFDLAVKTILLLKQ